MKCRLSIDTKAPQRLLNINASLDAKRSQPCKATKSRMSPQIKALKLKVKNIHFVTVLDLKLCHRNVNCHHHHLLHLYIANYNKSVTPGHTRHSEGLILQTFNPISLPQVLLFRELTLNYRRYFIFGQFVVENILRLVQPLCFKDIYYTNMHTDTCHWRFDY